jgi:hypothetical protein
MTKLNQSPIENKIREFKAGADYVFADEIHKDKAEMSTIEGGKEKKAGFLAGCTLREFTILSPQLKKVLREESIKQTETLLSLDFQ